MSVALDRRHGLWDPPRKNFWQKLQAQLTLQMMVLSGIVFIVIFSYLPMWGLLNAFKEYDIFKGFFRSPWVSLRQFQLFFNSPEWWEVLRNTVCISLLRLILGFPAPIILALLISEVADGYFKRFIQTVSYLPHFLSWVIVGGIVMSMLSTDNGSVNMLLQWMKLTKEPISFFTEPKYFWIILVSVGIWKEAGFSAIIYLAAIAEVDPHLYEAAEVDGASKFQQITKITLPCIMPVITILLILQLGSILSAGFEDILVLTNSGQNGILRSVADVIDIYSFRQGIQNYRYSYATAVGLFKSVVSIIILTTANFIARKTNGNSLW